MKMWMKFFAAVCFSVAVSTAAFAGEGNKEGKAEGKGGERKGIFERADTNKDGKIDATEVAAIKEPRLVEMLKKFDTNTDGAIDEKEIVVAKEGFAKRRAEREAAGAGKEGGKKVEKKEGGEAAK